MGEMNDYPGLNVLERTPATAFNPPAIRAAKAEHQPGTRDAAGVLLQAFRTHATTTIMAAQTAGGLRRLSTGQRQEILAGAIDQLNDRLGLQDRDLGNAERLQIQIDAFLGSAATRDHKLVLRDLRHIGVSAAALNETAPQPFFDRAAHDYGAQMLPPALLDKLLQECAPARPVAAPKPVALRWPSHPACV